MRDFRLASLLLTIFCGDAAAAEPPPRALIRQHCVSCHNADEKTAGLDLDAVSRDAIDQHTAVWENVVRKLRTRQMPPPEAERPDERTYVALLGELEAALDQNAVAHPDPGRIDTFRRLTRTEYQNAVRDL
ncbi:MAG TPA: c-type cytochrome domain-containing protein, partial [Planctomycetaceae bacterium]|nr:c-type cytochrome domain-containing protein [Planctomycetaceae bacterium]